MKLHYWMVLIVIAGGAVPAVQAQDDMPDWKRWTVRYFGAMDFRIDLNTSGLASYLEDNDFDDSSEFLGRTIDYPLTSAEGGTGWSFLAAYAYRPWLKIGGSYHQGVTVSARGLRRGQDGPDRVNMTHEMWAAAPVALWTPTSNLAIGAGPAVIRGTATFSDGRITLDPLASQEETYLRFGAVAFASLGFTLFRRTLYFGVQGQYLYGGEAEVGPYEIEPYTVEAGGVRVDQFMIGPVVEIRF